LTGPVATAIDEIRRTLSSLAGQGVKGVDLPGETMSILERWGTSDAPAPTGASTMDETLEQVRGDLGDCRRCGLSGTRTHLVFGAGNPSARLVFVGEAPGYDEDVQGAPFVGAAGKLLTRIVEAMGLGRGDVYICNILKCRPPGNRNPLPDEIDVCRPFLDRQLAAISPECICALGKFAAQTLLDTQAPISKLRGRFHEYNGIRVMPTYHPAYLLRNPEGKRDVWNDIQQIMAVLNLKVPDR
jgi:DNA polymerase